MHCQQSNGRIESQGPGVPGVREGGDQGDGAQRPVTAEGGGAEEEPGVDGVEIAETQHPGWKINLMWIYSGTTG